MVHGGWLRWCPLIVSIKIVNKKYFYWSLDQQILRSANVCLHFSRFKKTNDHKIQRKRKTYSYNIVLCPHYSFEESFIQKIYATLSIIMNILFFRNKKKSSCNIINCYIYSCYTEKNKPFVIWIYKQKILSTNWKKFPYKLFRILYVRYYIVG